MWQIWGIFPRKSFAEVVGLFVFGHQVTKFRPKQK
jgi:hypothetical protein